MSKYDPEKHHRRSIRLQHYDYTANGAYFVTICTYNRALLFGEMLEDKIELNETGLLIQQIWNDLPTRYPALEIDEFIVMPNHFHGVICMVGHKEGAAFLPTPRSGNVSLGNIIRTFKSVSTVRVNQLLGQTGKPLWQKGYYERVLRNEKELDSVRNYIVDNPLQWALDKENPQKQEIINVNY